MKKIILLLMMIISITANAEFVNINLISQDPDPVVAGDIVEIRFGLENTGSVAIENIMLEIDPDYPFQLVDGEDKVKSVGTLRANQIGNDMKIIKYKMRVDRETTAGTYNLHVYQYVDGKREQGYGQHTVSINVKNRESAEIIYIDKVELLPGKITPLTFTINNVGSASLKDLIFSWENEDGIILPVGSDDTKHVKSLDIGKNAEVSYNVVASSNAEPDLYKLTLTLTYTDQLTGTQTSINTNAGVYVGGSTDFDIAYSGSTNGETSFSISNIGSVPAASVTVKVPEQQAWRVTGTNSVIIGNLNKGDYTIAGFNIMPTGRQQDNPILLEIAFTDTRGERRTVTKEATVTSTTTSFAQNQTGAQQFRGRQTTPTTSNTWKWVTAGIVLVIYLIIRKKVNTIRKKDQSYTIWRYIKSLFGKK